MKHFKQWPYLYRAIYNYWFTDNNSLNLDFKRKPILNFKSRFVTHSLRKLDMVRYLFKMLHVVFSDPSV